jgi:hypothetical protein
MTADQIDDLIAEWELLTSALDYHAKKWYHCDNEGRWEQVDPGQVYDILRELGIDEKEMVIKQFRYRDDEAHARRTADMIQAQLRFKL